MLSIFPFEISQALNKLDFNKLFEVRLRSNRPIKILYDNKWGYLTVDGFSISIKNSYIADKDIISFVVVNATEFSLYSATDTIIKGYIPLSNGCRIGICGEVVNVDGNIKTIKNFTSLIIRFPHSVDNSYFPFIDFIVQNKTINNTLIISPPGGGKTTLLRSIAKQLSSSFNVLIIDERQEIAGVNEGEFYFDVNDCDVISCGNKSEVMSNAIRSCAPQIIITDEMSQDDFISMRYAVSCGVNIITSIHALSIENLLKKPNFEKFFSDKIFDRYIVLEGRENPGKCNGIYDANLSRIL